ncbi:N-glycosylase/DNA lyase [Halorhabdus salina]|uniref:N-glycosylase/DNA lyase n=1 Tax=Halorhabdus salina TaxID=2750670 RepID=UPI0015EEA239|nr:N-glycosylase/DNA lyase [Halorhabdus salina]
MNHDRIDSVATALAGIGYDGIVAFDRAEPEFGTIEKLFEEFDSDDYVQLLVVLATTQDYQLNGDAQRFWNEFEQTALTYDTLTSKQTVREILGDFMDADVNARLNQQKRDRLLCLFESDFDEWFLDNHQQATPEVVWKELADGLNTDMTAKTVALSMKVYDNAHLIQHGEYREFPPDIPIPCDLQVKRVSRTSGVTTDDDTERVLQVWNEVMDATSEQLGRHVSIFRIDSIVWQAGQIIGEHEPDARAARNALVEHFEDVGLANNEASPLARELTAEM